MSLNDLEDRGQAYCPLCEEVCASSQSRFYEIFGRSDSCFSFPIAKQYKIAPSIGALVPGHMLLVSRDHELNIGAKLHSHESISEFKSVINHLISAVSPAFGQKFIIFEHGSTRPSVTLCSTAHAHVHMVPIQAETERRVLDEVSAADPAELSWSELAQSACEAQDFVWVARATSSGVASRVQLLAAANRPSQFMRRIIANAIGMPTWDWKEDPRTSSVLATYQELRLRFSHNTVAHEVPMAANLSTPADEYQV